MFKNIAHYLFFYLCPVFCENKASAAGKPMMKFRIERLDLLAFIAVCFCRGIYCGGVAVERLWSNETGIPIIKELMSRNKWKRIMKYVHFSVS